MKNILLLALLAGATALEAQPALAQTTAPTSKKEMKQQRKARKQVGPEVYKGSVAEQNRIITDAAGSEKDRDDNGDEASTKKSKRKN